MTEWLDEVYYIIGSPKALTVFEAKRLDMNLPRKYELSPTSMVYINMSDGWTREECDQVVYIMLKSTFCKNNLELFHETN